MSGAPYNYNVTAVQGPGNGPVGTVYQTSPAVGTPLAPGSSITIFVVAPQSSVAAAEFQPADLTVRHAYGDAVGNSARDQLRLRRQGERVPRAGRAGRLPAG